MSDFSLVLFILKNTILNDDFSLLYQKKFSVTYSLEPSFKENKLVQLILHHFHKLQKFVEFPKTRHPIALNLTANLFCWAGKNAK